MEKIQVRVTKDKVSIETDNYLINTGEYHVNKCKFNFSDDYTDNLIKKAIFENGDERIEIVIFNDECDIPYEILSYDYFKLKVYAYEINNEELIIRYSPSPTIMYLRNGSYEGSNEVITPSQFEQYEQALNNGLDLLDDKLKDLDEQLVGLNNIDIDVSKVEHTTTISFTNRDGETSSIEVLDGETGNGIESISLNSDYTLTINYTDGTSYVTSSIRGERGEKGDTGLTGETGNGIDSVVLNKDYTLTINFTDGTSTTTTSIRGEKGEKGEVGTTGPSGKDGFSPIATVSSTPSGATISITDSNGTTSASVNNGTDGQDGYTPVRGTDYWTQQDIAIIQSYIDNQLGLIEEMLEEI